MLDAHLVEVADDFIQQPDTLDTVSTDGVLATKIPELGNWRKHDDNGVVRLVVKILKHNETKQQFSTNSDLCGR